MATRIIKRTEAIVVRYCPETKEYLVHPAYCSDPFGVSTYFTDDKEDALATAVRYERDLRASTTME